MTPDEKTELRVSNRMKEMMATEGWQIYAKLLDHHIRVATNEALQPDGSVDEAIARNGKKGAIIGLRLALTLPTGIINAADDLRTKLGGEIEED